jgi:ABC-type multidrug transport system ATPase subunit
MCLQVKNLTLTYPGSSEFVFRDLSFQLKEPGFNSLFGPSGVGKTSLAKVLTGDMGNFSGEIGPEGLRIFLYSYNTERLPDWSGIGKHLEKITPAGQQERREELIWIFGLKDCLRQRFSQMSLGQQNRVNLLRYLLQDFDLLIMDESLANVDELTREKIILRIKSLYPQRHFLYISHNVVEVSKFCREIVVLRGAERHPQSIIVRGQDARIDREIDSGRLNQTMLEIVSASS